MGMFDAEEIRAIRTHLGMTATEFGFRLGVSAHTVLSWEKGRRHPKYETMRKLNEMANGKSNGHAKRKAATA